MKIVHRASGCIGAALSLAAALSATAVAQPAPLRAVDAAARQQAIREAAADIRASYVFPDLGEQAAARIEARLAAGAYDAATDPHSFSEAVTSDLQAVTHDKHMRLMDDGGPPPNLPPPLRSDGGIARADRLAGGTGYIEIVAYPPLEIMRPALDGALARLKGSKALIIDERRNGGGSIDSVAYTVSHFLVSAQPVLLNEFTDRKRGTKDFSSRPETTVPTPVSFKGVPIIVLTSARTFSGGEEFAYDVQAFKLGTLIGETTGGGANPGGAQPAGAHFAVFVPTGRPINAITKTNWEGVGVKPDVVVPATDALKTALQRLGQHPAAADIDTLSQAHLFQPRTGPQDGSKAAVQAMLESLGASREPADLLSPAYAEAMRSPRGQEVTAAYRKQVAGLGAIQSVDFVEVDPRGADRYRAQLAGGALDVLVLLTPDKRVAGFAVRPLAK